MIRRAVASEAEPLSILHRASIVAQCSHAYSDKDINGWLAAITAETYSALMAQSVVLVADEVEEHYAGVRVCSPTEGLINACYVAPGMLRRGVGRRLMAAMEAVLSDSGAQEARLHATLNAVAFYRALGYREETPTTNVLPSSVELPCVAMTKPLS